MTGIPAPRRRDRRIVPVLVAVGALAVVSPAIQRAGAHQDGPGPRPVASLPPASASAVNVGYVGNRWRLTRVADARGTTEIPESAGAWLELGGNGELGASDAVHGIDGKYHTASGGFEVTDAIVTTNAYVGDDPAILAAITGIDAMTMAAHVTVLSAERGHLTVQAAGVRLTFVRTGPAVE